MIESSIPSGLVRRDVSVGTPKFDNPADDPRLLEGTAQGLRDLASGGPMEFPTRDWKRQDTIAWWKQIGPAFAAVNGQWAGPMPPEIESKVTKSDVTYEGIPIRVFLRRRATRDVTATNQKALPVVIYLHGGGFAMWSCKDPAFDGYLTRLAALGECIVVAVDYRLAVDAPFPACLEDSFKVTEWVATGGAAQTIIGVPAGGKVVLAGDSAGSNIAFGTALKAKRAGLDLVAGLYLMCPYAAGSLRETSSSLYPSMAEFDGYYCCEGFLQAVHNTTCMESEKDEWFRSPLLIPLCTSKEEMATMPPTSIIVGELDMLRDMGIELHHRLKEAGASASSSMLTIIGGAIHEQQLFALHSPHVTNQSIHDLAGFAQYVCGRD